MEPKRAIEVLEHRIRISQPCELREAMEVGVIALKFIQEKPCDDKCLVEQRTCETCSWRLSNNICRNKKSIKFLELSLDGCEEWESKAMDEYEKPQCTCETCRFWDHFWGECVKEDNKYIKTFVDGRCEDWEEMEG